MLRSLPCLRWLLALVLLLALRPPTRAQQPGYRFSQDILAQWQRDTLWANYQNYAVEFSRIGDYPRTLAAQAAFEQGRRSPDTNIRFDSAYFRRFRAVSAGPELLRRTAARQLVILNEAHYQPRNRVFTRSLLAGLYRQGFRYLCLEDLANGPAADTGLNQRRYPLHTTGFYATEPQYGDLERHALALGFRLVPYEHVPTEPLPDPMARMMARERGQAQNIQQILARDPQARIVVHVGYGHLVEQLAGNGQFGFMAAFLKKSTGLDPFTIHQVDLLEHADPALDNAYRALMRASEPSVFIDAQDNLFNSAQNPEKWDASVYFPATTYEHGRPTWLRQGTGRRCFLVPSARITVAFPCRVEAYHAAEDATRAVPADVVELQNVDDDRALVLAKGRYTLVLHDAHGGRQLLAATVP